MIRDREADHVVDVAEDHRLAAHPTEDADVQEIAATQGSLNVFSQKRNGDFIFKTYLKPIV